MKRILHPSDFWGALGRFFLGSVAERVVGTAPCPVLTVRGR